MRLVIINSAVWAFEAKGTFYNKVPVISLSIFHASGTQCWPHARREQAGRKWAIVDDLWKTVYKHLLERVCCFCRFYFLYISMYGQSTNIQLPTSQDLNPDLSSNIVLSIFSSLEPSILTSAILLVTQILACLADISSWMESLRRKLNPSETKLLYIPENARPCLNLAVFENVLFTPSEKV